MAIIIKPPQPLDFDRTKKSVFLAGSIELGAAEDWQQTVTAALAELDIVILNPRRDAWDASWPQSIDFEPFRGQVEWELEAQELADLILFYFAPNTKAPITLLELGLAAHTEKAVVCCPDGFWRKGNVEVVCRRYGMRQVESLQELIASVTQYVSPQTPTRQPGSAAGKLNLLEDEGEHLADFPE